MEYIFPAVFRANDDDSYTIMFPDLPGCVSEGKSLGNALCMAQSALTQWVTHREKGGTEIPKASPLFEIATTGGEIKSLVRAETKDPRAVRRTVSIPRWMDDLVTKYGLSLSRILQDALSERFTRVA